MCSTGAPQPSPSGPRCPNQCWSGTLASQVGGCRVGEESKGVSLTLPPPRSLQLPPSEHPPRAQGWLTPPSASPANLAPSPPPPAPPPASCALLTPSPAKEPLPASPASLAPMLVGCPLPWPLKQGWHQVSLSPPPHVCPAMMTLGKVMGGQGRASKGAWCWWHPLGTLVRCPVSLHPEVATRSPCSLNSCRAGMPLGEGEVMRGHGGG